VRIGVDELSQDKLPPFSSLNTKPFLMRLLNWAKLRRLLGCYWLPEVSLSRTSGGLKRLKKMPQTLGHFGFNEASPTPLYSSLPTESSIMSTIRHGTGSSERIHNRESGISSFLWTRPGKYWLNLMRGTKRATVCSRHPPVGVLGGGDGRSGEP